MQYQTQPQCAQLYTTHFGYSMQTNWYSLYAHVSSLLVQYAILNMAIAW